MLEKIRLPPKPSVRGSNWVADGPNCQGCSSHFTFINRKHHCRRCGGLFCGRCTQQRMVLRGQGDSPVRICDPCKTLEEAARFETRYGSKSRASKGGSRVGSVKEDEILNQILGNEEKASSTQRTVSSASCSNIPDLGAQIEGGDVARKAEVDSATPEELREEAMLEKKRYKTLKAEGKPEEALRAFKRGKELERQAEALEISLRKNRKKASSSSNLDDARETKDDSKGSSGKGNFSTQKSKAKDDLSAELRELGWSDMDLHDAEKKPVTLSLEGELSSLAREVSQKPNKEKGAISNERSQVLVLKRKALELKRAGNLADAKEELKKAKILERKIEENELLGDTDDSDDELSALIRSMDADETDDSSARHKSDLNISFDHFVGIGDDLVGNFEVTDEDMDDPEMASALESLGWTEDAADSKDLYGQGAPSKNGILSTEIQSLKREAVTQKRAGNNAEAMALLKKAKLREMELESSKNKLVAPASTDVQKSSVSYSAIEPFFSTKENVVPPKSKLTIQKELLALKKKALSLRREGKLEESEQELEKAKVLEQQLEVLNKAPTVTVPSTITRQTYNDTHASLGDGDEEEVTDQDMHDPSYLSLLKNLGWEDEENLKVTSTVLKENVRISEHTNGSSVAQSNFSVETGMSRKSKSEIQRELLALKRKALTLRRQGEAEEADEVLKMAGFLEAQLQEHEEPIQKATAENNKGNAPFSAPQNTRSSHPVDLHEMKIGDQGNQDSIRRAIPEEKVRENAKPYIHEPSASEAIYVPPPSSLRQEILAHKRRAITFKREGKLAEAKEELRQAKLLEKRIEEDVSQTSTNSSDASASNSSPVVKKESSPSPVSKPLSSRDKFKLQQESLSHKRNALKLRREGRTAEADVEFELAKTLETQLQESDESHDPTKSSGASVPVDDVMVEDFLDPQLLSALQSIGLGDVQTQSSVRERPETTKSDTDNTEDAKVERELLAERIKVEKVKAVNLKRSGKQAEALDALRRAKLYEKKLQSLTST